MPEEDLAGPHPFEKSPEANLRQFLAAGTHQERSDAACALGNRLRTNQLAQLEPATIERLVDLLEYPWGPARLEAAIALAEAGDHRATPTLLAASTKRQLRLDAVRALGAGGDPRAIAPLRKLMTKFILPWADRLQAGAALCALGDSLGQEYLVKASGSRKSAEKAAALHFLAESQHPEALSLLLEALAADDTVKRSAAVRALVLLGEQRGLTALSELQKTAEPELAEEINEALAGATL